MAMTMIQDMDGPQHVFVFSKNGNQVPRFEHRVKNVKSKSVVTFENAIRKDPRCWSKEG